MLRADGIASCIYCSSRQVGNMAWKDWIHPSLVGITEKNSLVSRRPESPHAPPPSVLGMAAKIFGAFFKETGGGGVGGFSCDGVGILVWK